MATISVIVPAYNEEQTIAACLDHLLDQTRAPDEIIVVDNACTDETGNIARTYAEKHPTIRVIREDKPGIYSARKAGFDAARSDIIARTDADTFVSRTWCEAIDATLGDGGVAEVMGATGPTLYWGAPAYSKFKAVMLRGKLAAEGGIVPSMAGLNTAVRRSVWTEIKDTLIDRPDIWEDMDLSMTMRERGMKIFFCPDMLVDTSTRQLRHSPWRNRHYILGGIRTAIARGDKKLIAAMIAELPFRLAMLVAFWIVFGSWNDEDKTWRPHRLVKPVPRERRLITEGR